MSDGLGLIHRAVRYFIPRSKEPYYSSEKWNDSWSSGYDLNIAQEDGRYGTLMALMHRYERGGPLLDVGCGDGLLEERYRKLSSVQIVAFDYSETAIERAKTRHLPNVDFYCADSRTFKSEKQFSMVVLNESLYYVDDYLGLLKNLSRALKADGVFIVSMHHTRITKRIWKNLLRSYNLLHGVALRNEPTNGLWHIRVLGSSK